MYFRPYLGHSEDERLKTPTKNQIDVFPGTSIQFTQEQQGGYF